MKALGSVYGYIEGSGLPVGVVSESLCHLAAAMLWMR
jgi:hypothetical protein